MNYHGRVENGVVVLDNQIRLPEGTKVRVEPIEEQPRRTLAERFRNIIGVADDMPEDMAEQHNHYIHGTPKKA